MRSVSEWLDGLGLGEYAAAFAENAVDFDLLTKLTADDIRDIGVKRVGDRRRLLDAIAALSEAAAPDRAGPGPDADGGHQAERRQITVMFCDLVGSTALSEKLDPEDLQSLMQTYQQAAGAVIARYDGHVAQYLGDGIMAYFGWPRAHGDDAERAVRASLEMVERIAALATPEPLAVRIGIATGAVVVGETGAGDASVPKMAVGETPNLAARLQALAVPNAIVISPVTRQLVADIFSCEDLGSHELKGIGGPVLASIVLGLRDEPGDDAAAGHPSP